MMQRAMMIKLEIDFLYHSGHLQSKTLEPVSTDRRNDFIFYSVNTMLACLIFTSSSIACVGSTLTSCRTPLLAKIML